jgi:hypothetical protein
MLSLPSLDLSDLGTDETFFARTSGLRSIVFWIHQWDLEELSETPGADVEATMKSVHTFAASPRLEMLYQFSRLTHVKLVCEVSSYSSRHLGLAKNEDITSNLRTAKEEVFRKLKRVVVIESKASVYGAGL